MIYSEQDYFIIVVSNDGLPFNVEDLETNSGIGLKNIQYRINYLNGKLDISSDQNLTQFKIQIPIKPKQ
jgi:signal transduction histidine kinase